MRTALVAAAALAAGAVVGLGVSGSAETAPVAPLPFWTSRVCQHEDSNNCAWDAGASGNGAGHSFIVRKVPHGGPVCVFYVERGFARDHDYCE